MHLFMNGQTVLIQIFTKLRLNKNDCPWFSWNLLPKEYPVPFIAGHHTDGFPKCQQFFSTHRSLGHENGVLDAKDKVLIGRRGSYPETTFDEVIEANRRGTWTINAVTGN